MFDKMTLFIDKAALIACLGFIIATCACFMIKNGIEHIILGGGTTNSYPRTKGFILLCVALTMLALAVIIIFANKSITEILIDQVKESPVVQAYLG